MNRCLRNRSYLILISASIRLGLLPNGNFELGPKPSQLKGSEVRGRTAIPSWTISGFVEYIKSGQKQGDMLLVVPEGAYAVRLGNEASIRQKVKLTKGGFYSLTLSAARTCAQEEKLNVSVAPTTEKTDWGVFPIQTMYGSNGWESFACGFRADFEELDIVIHNPVNLLKNGNFEEGPYVLPNTSWGVLIPPHIEDAHSPLPGWIVESLKAVKYIDSSHFSVPQGTRAIELVAGKESAIAQVVPTTIGKDYELTFAVGDANGQCAGSMQVEAFAAKSTVRVPYESKGRGGFVRGRLRFKAVGRRTRVVFLSSFYTMKSDNSGALCGPVIDDVRKKVEDVMPIATGHEREEIEAELQGKKLLDINFPEGPFGTKEAPAVVKSYYDKRIVGCPGGEGEDEHDVVWFWLEKGKPHECPVCTQYFELEVVGPGGPPDGHGDDDHHH
ncbi:uncharacterized protein G2W53_028311 [Senna tora]|uniref:DUF642 domain-containing protein n=1 Tax=Senna tora TaxID=362788 RepID=A0A834W9M6_9FABA|nr:uncharacterized protein G2W53_028311 [Senna tora]